MEHPFCITWFHGNTAFHISVIGALWKTRFSRCAPSDDHECCQPRNLGFVSTCLETVSATFLAPKKLGNFLCVRERERERERAKRACGAKSPPLAARPDGGSQTADFHRSAPCMSCGRDWILCGARILAPRPALRCAGPPVRLSEPASMRRCCDWYYHTVCRTQLAYAATAYRWMDWCVAACSTVWWSACV